VLVRLHSSDPIACPSCGKTELERVPSTFGMSSDESRAANVVSARKYNLSLEREKKRVEIDDPHRH
jgi:hypothetical protein